MNNDKLFSLVTLPPRRIKRLLISAVFTLICSIAFWIQDQRSPIRSLDTSAPIALYANQVDDNLTATFSHAIDEAKQSILLIVYSLTDTNIISRLTQKSLQGVDVRVIYDAEASPYADTKLGGKIHITKRFGPGLMHQKILVTDREKVLLGSANMTRDSLRMHGNLVIGMQSPQLAERIQTKAAAMSSAGPGLRIPSEIFSIGGQSIELWFLPDNQKAALRLKTLIRSAQKSISVAMFTWTRHDLANAVIGAARRGIRVEVVIDRNSGKGAGAGIVKLLKENNINIRLSTGAPLLHHKFLYIDENLLVNGSANWTKRAFTQNDDCFIVIHDLTTEQREQMNALWKRIVVESAPPGKS